jgi:subfamily B ATP-binding cassette protein MsbA
MEYIKKILAFALPYKKYAFLNIISNIFQAIFNVLSLIAVGPLLKVLFNETKPVTIAPTWEGILKISDYANAYLNFHFTKQIAANGMEGALLIVITLIVVLFFLKNIFAYSALYFITFLRNGVVKDIRNAMHKKVLDLPLSFFSEKRKGDILARMTSDVGNVEWSFLRLIEMLVREPLTIIISLITMLIISVKLTIFMFIFLPFSGGIIAFIGKKLKAQSDDVQLENGHFLSQIEESLSGLRVIKGFNAEDEKQNQFESITSSLFRKLNKMLNRQNLSSPVSEFLGVLVIVAILFYGGRLVVSGELEGGTLITFLMLAYSILQPVKQISNAIYSIKVGNASAERILTILETENPISDKVDAIQKSSFEEAISIENITFAYEDQAVLKDFSLKIPKGKIVALVGQSGSGKSTIANLLMRFYDVNKGEIKLDNINIKEVKKKSLRGLMGIVTQDAILFNDTVRNNIALGMENTTDEAIINACKIANAHDFIMQLPKQYDTNIGDGGGKLSGGQKQRLSIARAVLKNPPIMILDEATSALDTESERLVQDALNNMMKNRTSVVIAHRLSTIQNADTIVVMHQGKIVEQGKHEELLSQNGTYKKLVEMQSFG